MEERWKKYAVGVLGTAAVLIALDAMLLEQYFFRVKEYDIGHREKRGTPVKFIHLTDLHLREKADFRYRKLAVKINSLDPDLLLITGDAIDQKGKPYALDAFLGLLREDIRKVAILGNHEYKSSAYIPQLKEIYNNYNATLLIDESKAFTIRGNRIMITGMNDWVEGEPVLRDAVKHTGREENHLVMIHSPLHYSKVKEEIERINAERNEEEKLNISYFFAGHTHGGQVRLGSLAPVLPKKSGSYLNGWYGQDKPWLYVSKGFGNSTIQLRFAARSELVVFNYYC